MRRILTATFFLSILAAPVSLAQLVTISLDMLPQELILDRAGSRALLVDGYASRQRLSDGDGETNLVLVDLDTQAVIKKKKFAKQIRAMHMEIEEHTESRPGPDRPFPLRNSLEGLRRGGDTATNVED